MSEAQLKGKADRLAEIAQDIAGCSLCRSWGDGRPVPGEGNPEASVVLIGEAPGRQEAETRRPFVGRSGKFLRGALRELGIKENDLFITSPVKYLPKKGTPSKENVAHGRGHLLRQLEVIDPDVVVLMGAVACRGVLDRNVQISEEHGRVIQQEGRKYLITFHPAYAARFPEGKRGFLDDLKKLKRLIRD